MSEKTKYILDPNAIEQESFRIIEEELGPHSFSREQFLVVQRMIHAAADFDFAKNVRFHPKGIVAGVAALRGGCDIVCDVQMIEAGVSRAQLTKLGKGQVRCFISDPDVVEEAKAAGVTRAIMSMRKSVRVSPGAVYAIGNAPTALLEIIRLCQEEGAKPALIVGIPVGFVSATESKEELLKADVPYITSRGRKGGTSVTVATVNALLRLATGVHHY